MQTEVEVKKKKVNMKKEVEEREEALREISFVYVCVCFD